MKKTNIATLRSELSKMLDYVQKGRELEIQKRNVTIAKIVPVQQMKKNKTKLGKGRGTVTFLGDLTEPFLDEKEWDMYKNIE